MERTLASVEDTYTEAERFVTELIPHEQGATLVTLSGELGAGKTTFTQALAKALGITDTVTSPTFVLEKIYELPVETGRGFRRLFHIDAYRLKDGEDLATLGFTELMNERTNLVILEWPERVTDALPETLQSITLSVSGTGRTISYA